MEDTNMEDKSLELDLGAAFIAATIAHRGQIDKRGEPCIYHVMRVAAAGHTLEEKLVGCFHDVLEDSTEFTADDIRRNFSNDIADAVVALTRRPGESYLDEYIPRVLQNPLATEVKLHDLTDNMAYWRQDFPGHDRLYKRHNRAFEIIMQEKVRRSGIVVEAA